MAENDSLTCQFSQQDQFLGMLSSRLFQSNCRGFSLSLSRFHPCSSGSWPDDRRVCHCTLRCLVHCQARGYPSVLLLQSDKLRGTVLFRNLAQFNTQQCNAFQEMQQSSSLLQSSFFISTCVEKNACFLLLI